MGGVGTGRRWIWLVLAGLLDVGLIAGLLWLMENTEPPGLSLLIPLGIAAMALIVVPSAYLAVERFADDATAMRVVRRIVVAAVGLMLVGLVFVAGVETARRTAPEVEQAPDDTFALSIAMLSILVPGALAFAGLVLGPWAFLVVRTFARALNRERAARARAEERAAMAAHLHDSVLQTLTLLQKRATDPGAVVRFARHTERDLRAFLYGSVDGGGGDLAGALARELAAVEDRYDVTVDLVTAGTCPLDERTHAVVGATREAVTNAARHARVSRVAVFADVDGGEVLVRVRDRGCGFDGGVSAPDRHGIRNSIIGRMDRHGGRATVESAIGEGTEVELRMPVGGAA